MYNRSMKTTRKNRWSEYAGYLGMIMVHSAIVPTTVANIFGWSDKLPPISMVLLVQIGLLLFLVRAVATKDMLYILSNGFGFWMQTVLLAVIVFR